LYAYILINVELEIKLNSTGLLNNYRWKIKNA